MDLLLVLLVAALVGVAPGWFWAGLLLPRKSPLSSRLAYSGALSLALVSAVAFAMARLSGTGVTLFMAVAAPVFVLVVGLAARIHFGSSADPEETLDTPPAPPGARALAPAVLALGLVLVTTLLNFDSFWLAGNCMGWPSNICTESGGAQRFVVPVALLLIAAGVAYFFAARRGTEEVDEPEPTDPGRSRVSVLAGRMVSRLGLPAVLLLVLVRGYSGPVLRDWPHVRGLDHYSHTVMANLMMGRAEIEPYLIYPPGFHTMSASVSRLTGLDPLDVFVVLGPAFILLPAVSCYVLARSLWGPGYGLAAAFFVGVLAGGPYYYLNDAMYPNVVAAQFLVVLALPVLLSMYRSPSWRTGLLLALLGSAVFFYHQVSALYLALVLAFVGLVVVPVLLVRARSRGLALLLSLALLGASALAAIWQTYDLPRVVATLLGDQAGDTATAVDMAVGSQQTYEVGYFIGAILSQPVAWMGLLGAALLAADARGWRSWTPVLTRATLLFWPLILFAGSRTSFSGFPQRFGRDLGVPLSIFAALALVLVLRSLVGRRGPVVVFAAALMLLLSLSLVGLRTAQSYDQSAGPSLHLTMTDEIASAGAWLAQNNTGGNILVGPQGNQVPSRMMLAMGDYSALQSFTERQVTYPRDLPPTGEGPLRDVLWVVDNPESEYTDRLLDRHDIRYLVLYKDMPDRPVNEQWELFAASDLYQSVFENGDVLIVERR